MDLIPHRQASRHRDSSLISINGNVFVNGAPVATLIETKEESIC